VFRDEELLTAVTADAGVVGHGVLADKTSAGVTVSNYANCKSTEGVVSRVSPPSSPPADVIRDL